MNLLTNTVLLKENELKKVLKEIQNRKKIWNEENKVFIVKSMIKHIGSIDSELRDQLIYGSFYQLIIEKNLLEHALLIELLDLGLSDLLFKGIGETETDTVFTRSFTSLLMALILYRDNEDNFLSQSMVYKIKDKLIDYISLENDLRGYIAVKGWSHSIAHVADAFDELVKNPKINQEFYLDILKTLWNKIFVSTSVYAHDEDERILIPIMEMLNRGMEQEEIETLIQNVPTKLKSQKEQIEAEKYWFLYFNCKTFLKSFYIKVQANSNLIPLQNSLKECLSSISLYN
ncbi:DUF2785 domain-containing protein [Rummeliibacillus suwonensis]|uniref:DUF2785 domain-containing protein n=1 Tax=Rummeliibacillus suwonensis TaxID=1306154 RepID=UPI001AAE5396|nr:DUF2785 domain-containing protein [Rummeliibacillus suwonensis]MBO2537058.1 DUF2785 domain-containing protein [Rummeliibacillus suwonensis]